jgi:23S rRNA (guanosine2251-2'-O)-methyltransferase
MNEASSEVIYGIHPAEEILRMRPQCIHRVFFSQSYGKQLFPLLKECRKKRVPCQLIPPIKLSRLAGTEKHQGIVIQCSIKPFADIHELLENLVKAASPPLLVVPASIEDPHNLGACIRSAVAFDVSAILLERRHSVHLNAAVAKASAGMIEHIPIARPRNLEAVLDECRNSGFGIVGAVQNDGVGPQEIDFTRPTVLVVGGENRGIPPYLLSLCTQRVAIPTSSTVGSLNVSVACAILLYECSRQRLKMRNA